VEEALESAVEGCLRFVPDLGGNLGDTAGARRERERQAPLRRAYSEDPQGARSVKWAETAKTAETDAFHSVVQIGKGYGISQRTGIDRTIGGDHDLPNPGDLLCGALAACQDGAIRMVADLLGVPLLELRVEVIGEVDVRGCLAADRSVRVGFRTMSCRVHLRLPPETDPKRVALLRKQAEQSCVNLDTLRSGVPVELAFNVL
jgi:uncharacterized OsmC-like protein